MAREQFQTLTEPMYYILLALTQECCGVDIMDRVRQISNGRIKVGPGTLYAMLSKFEENNIIKKTTEAGRRKSCRSWPRPTAAPSSAATGRSASQSTKRITEL